MPRVRRLGNRMYALILSALSNKVVTDTASGMRVIRRDALERLYPLPDGLHFTPAMSARVLMDDELTLTETPMTYEDRIGESKLHVLHDGMRFLRTILEMTLMWKPGKVFVGAAVCCALAMTVLAIHPIEMWLRNGSLQEDMIYRLLFCSLLGTFSATLFSCGIISEHLRRLLGSSQRPATFLWATMDKVFTLGGVGVATLCGLPILTWLVGEGIWTRATAGYVDLHWSRVVLAGLVVFGLVQTFATVLIVNLIRFHTQRKTTSVHAGSVAVSTKTHIAVPTPPRRTAVPVMS